MEKSITRFSQFHKLLRVCLTLVASYSVSEKLYSQCGSGYQNATLDWESANWGPGFTGINNYLLHGTNVRITINGQHTTNAWGISTPADNSAMAGRGGYGDNNQQLEISENDRRGISSVVVNLSQTVYNLRFSLYDVDNLDILSIVGYNGVTPITPTITYEDPINRDFNIVGSSVRGNGQANNNDDGTANVVFPLGVTSFTVATTTAERPDYAITDIHMCVPTVIIANTCQDYSSVNWNISTYNAGQTSSQVFQTYNDVTLAPTGITADFRWTGNTSHFVSGFPANPNPGDFSGNGGVSRTNRGLEMLVDAPGGGTSSIVNLHIRTSQVVTEGRFNISDIDNSYDSRSTANRIDQVTITAYNLGVPVPVAFVAETDGSSYGLTGNVLQGHPFGNVDGCISAPGVGGGTNGNSEPDRGTVNVYINGAFDQITIAYAEAGNASNPYIRGIELDNVTFCPPQVLPIDIVKFDGQINSQNLATLNWQASNEKNLAHYTILYSHDGNNEIELGNVNANGNEMYQYAHEQQASTGYYRLKMVHTNGEVKFSDFVSLSYQNKADKINIAESNYAIEIANLLKGGTMHIVNLNGQVIKTFNNVPDHMELNTQDMVAGMYIVQNTAAGQQQTAKILIR